ncbi:MAG: hypothetical protein WAV40_05340 [Microgenomates group bacterium]
MKVNHLAIFFLICVGVAVGLFSLYTASLSGVMAKMGLYGGDFSNSIKFNELSRRLRNEEDRGNCGVWAVARDIPGYFLAKGVEKIKLGGLLGNERIKCGVRYVQEGNVERGVYTIVKGLYYLKNGYMELKPVVLLDRTQCVHLDSPDFERWVENYLKSTEGRVHDVVYDLYKQVERERAGVEELCLD